MSFFMDENFQVEFSAHWTCIQNRCVSHFHAKVHMMPLKGVFSSLGMWDAGILCADPPHCAVHSVLHDVAKMWTDISLLHCIALIHSGLLYSKLCRLQSLSKVERSTEQTVALYFRHCAPYIWSWIYLHCIQLYASEVCHLQCIKCE